MKIKLLKAAMIFVVIGIMSIPFILFYASYAEDNVMGMILMGITSIIGLIAGPQAVQGILKGDIFKKEENLKR